MRYNILAFLSEAKFDVLNSRIVWMLHLTMSLNFRSSAVTDVKDSSHYSSRRSLGFILSQWILQSGALLAWTSEEQVVDSKKMRQHLLQCFENGVMRPFPSAKRKLVKVWKKEEAVKVYCKCRMQEAGNMISCDMCGEWYHDTCINVAAEAWVLDDYNWYGSNCN